VVARLVGVYLTTSEDAVVENDGSFTIHAWWIGGYELWIISGGKVVAERDVKIDFEPKELRLPDIPLAEK
jgi:hypothetical protein